MAEKKVADKVEERVLTFADPEWSDFVIGQLTEDEIIDGAPKADGLIRLVEKLIGEIVYMDSGDVVQCPCPENMGRATVKARLHILRHKDQKLVEYSSAADVHTRNTDAPFNQYPVAVAGTRALGRCCKMALRIKTVTAEEKSQNAEYASEVDEDGSKITEPQIKGIANLCKTQNINLEKFVNAGSTQYKSIRDVSLSKGVMMLRTLNEYRNGVRQVSENIQGFDPDWKSSFSN